MINNYWLTGPLIALVATAALAQDDDSQGFVEANILSIFYHELGHAVIDIEGVPIFGQEEDAADVFSIFLIDAFFEAEASETIAWDAALGFWGEAEMREAMQDDVPWWDVHGPDEQRFYNTVCLFYGADPNARVDYADELGLPEERADTCSEEYDQAAASWGPVLDELTSRGGGDSLTFEGQDDSLTSQILSVEIDELNADLTVAEPLAVVLESCGEANAFYDPETVTITMCSEFEDYLVEMEERF